MELIFTNCEAQLQMDPNPPPQKRENMWLLLHGTALFVTLKDVSGILVFLPGIGEISELQEPGGLRGFRSAG